MMLRRRLSRAQQVGTLLCSRIVLSLIVLGLLVLTSAPVTWAGTGLAFLKHGVDARSMIFGEALTSHVANATAAYWNPAGLALLESPQIALSHIESFAELRHEFVSIAQPLGEGGLVTGIHFNGLWTDDIEGYDSHANPTGKFGYGAYAVGVSLGKEVREGILLGVTAKYISENIHEYSATGWAGDLGLQWAPSATHPLMFGAAVRNVGSSMAFIVEDVELPLTIQGGVSYAFPLVMMSGELLTALEVRDVKGQGSSIHGGLEYSYRHTIHFGMGYQSGHDTRDVSVGLGVQHGRMAFDWAYVPVAEDLGDEHRFSLQLDL